jgi:hypothetical protein
MATAMGQSTRERHLNLLERRKLRLFEDENSAGDHLIIPDRLHGLTIRNCIDEVQSSPLVSVLERSTVLDHLCLNPLLRPTPMRTGTIIPLFEVQSLCEVHKRQVRTVFPGHLRMNKLHELSQCTFKGMVLSS